MVEVLSRLRTRREDRALLVELVEALPSLWLPETPAIGGADEQRAAYVGYLLRRLEAPREFVEEAERARVAA